MRDGRWSRIAQTGNTVRHTKCARIRGMVVGEGGRSSGVLLYLHNTFNIRAIQKKLSIKLILLNLYLETKKSFNFLLNWFSDTASLNCWGSVFQNFGPV